MAFSRGTLAACLVSILGTAACTAPSAAVEEAPPPTAEPPPADTAPPPSVPAPQLTDGHKAGALGGIDGAPVAVQPSQSDGEHCSATLIAPASSVLPLGSNLVVATSLTCPPGKEEALLYRFELTGPNGGIAMPGFGSTAHADLDATKLDAAGDYALVVVTEPASLEGDVAADPAAIAAATHRSQPIAFTVAVAEWREAWSACSSTCEGGTQSSSYSCGAGATAFDAAWCTGAMPDAQQRVCNVDACPNVGATWTIAGQSYSGGSGIEQTTDKDVTFWQAFADTTIDGTTYFVAIYALTLPTTETDLPATDVYPPRAGEVWVEAYVQTADETNDWWSSSASPPVKFRFGADGKLHALVDDPALVAFIGTGSPAVTADIPLP